MLQGFWNQMLLQQHLYKFVAPIQVPDTSSVCFVITTTTLKYPVQLLANPTVKVISYTC
jgi:hypothetical protein